MNNQLKLGIFTIIGLFAIVVSILATGVFSLGKTYNIYVKFDNIAGLTKKAKVKVAGVDIGVLKGISLEDSKAKLELSIDNNVVLYKNASANIVSMSIIGTKYIEIVPGDSSSSLLKNGDYVSADIRSSLEGAITNSIEKINKALDNEKYGNMAENFADAMRSFKDLLENLATHNDGIAEIVKNFSKFSADLASVSANNKQDLRDAVRSIKDVVSKLDILIARVYDGNGAIATLINDEQFGKDLKETVTSAKVTINSLKDTIGKFDRLKLSLDYVGGYSMKDKKCRNDVGISIMPSEHRFYYLGFSRVAGSDSLEALVGVRSKKSEVYCGAIRGELGIGLGYSFFQPIYAPYKALKVHLNAYDFFAKENHGPQIDAGVRFGIAKWLYAGIAVEDIAYKTAVTPYLKIEI